MKLVCFTVISIALASPLSAQTADTSAAPADNVNPDAGVPVFPYDITDRPYEVIGEIKAEVRKGTIFSKEASQAKIYKELWERGRKLNADAVIKASYGDARVTMMSWGSIKATGTAIRFKPTEAAPAAPTPASVEQAPSQ